MEELTKRHKMPKRYILDIEVDGSEFESIKYVAWRDYTAIQNVRTAMEQGIVNSDYEAGESGFVEVKALGLKREDGTILDIEEGLTKRISEIQLFEMRELYRGV